MTPIADALAIATTTLVLRAQTGLWMRRYRTVL